MSPVHTLAGCQPEPLGGYLKALGILRLVTEQLDGGTTGHWTNTGFALGCGPEREELEQFFLEAYRPTPVVSPWNSSSGFGKEGAGELQVIERSSDPRLGPYREAIAVARGLLAHQEAAGWDKETMVAACRAELPNACLGWLDGTVVLAADRAVYPPMLGTGGNDGRLEFSRNFHQRVLDVLGLSTEKGADPRGWLRDTLDGTSASAARRNKSPGQFDPAAAGGPNSAATGAADSLLNPWDWVLLLEGAIMFASGAARRLASDVGGRAAIPFTVDSSAVGYASAVPGEDSRGELWLPLWDRPAATKDVRRLLAEGRGDWRGRHARTALELTEAAASLGVDRGIDAFSRHVLLVRNGLATVAAPAGRIEVAERAGMRPLATLEVWLDRVRRARASLPTGAATHLRRIEQTTFRLASERHPAVDGRGSLLEVLLRAADLESSIGRSRARERVPMLSGACSLDARLWVPLMLREARGDGDRGGLELRLAVALASGRDGEVRIEGSSTSGASALGGLAAILRASWTREGRLSAPAVSGVEERRVVDVLADVHKRRVLDILDARGGAGTEHAVGVATRFAYAATARLEDVAAFVLGLVDADALRDALRACLLLDYRKLPADALIAQERASSRGVLVPPVLAVLGPFYARQPSVRSIGGASVDSPGAIGEWQARLDRTTLTPEAEWPALLAAGRVEAVLEAARRRLRIAGIAPVPSRGGSRRRADDQDVGRHVAAALLCTLDLGARRRMLRSVSPSPGAPSTEPLDPDLPDREHPGEEHRDAEP
ncbi:MAG: type I-G CRISPR-associated protein Cas8g1/Csx17 [Deltaproteobacteria bacterium]